MFNNCQVFNNIVFYENITTNKYNEDIDTFIKEIEILSKISVNNISDSQIDNIEDMFNFSDSEDESNIINSIESIIPVITPSDIIDYNKRNNVNYYVNKIKKPIRKKAKRKKAKRKPGVKESKRKSDVANKRKRINGRFIKNTHKITSSI